MKPPRRTEREQRVERIRKMVSAGYTYREIGEELGVSRQRVWQIFRKHYPAKVIHTLS